MPPALLDTNVLVHAAYLRSPLHSAASQLVARGLSQSGVYCLAPQNLVEFAAVVSRTRFVAPPLSPAELSQMAETLYRSRRLSKVYPRRGSVIRAIREGASLGITGPAWYDLFLAVTMRDAGVEVIITEDVDDFERIPFITARTIRQEAGVTS